MTRLLRRSTALLATTASVLFALLALTTAPAHAAWSTLSNYGSGKVAYLACKTLIDGAYGPVYKIDLVMATQAGYSGTATFRGLRYGDPYSSTTVSASNGRWGTRTVYISRWHNDTWQTSFSATDLRTGAGSGSAMSAPMSAGNIRFC